LFLLLIGFSGNPAVSAAAVHINRPSDGELLMPPRLKASIKTQATAATSMGTGERLRAMKSNAVRNVGNVA
jgi:hypothetical protein